MRIFLFCILFAIAPGCDKSADKPADKTTDKPADKQADKPADKSGLKPATPNAAKPATPTPDTKPAPVLTKIKLKDGSGKEAFSLKPKPDGAKLMDADGNKIVRIKTRGDAIKLKGQSEEELGFVAGDASRIGLRSPDMASELYHYKRQDDGDYKLKDGTNALLYKIKKRDYGFEIQDADGKEVYKVKVKDEGKVSLRKPDGTTVYSTKDPVSPAAMACLGFDKLSLPHRIGLFWQMQRVSGASK